MLLSESANIKKIEIDSCIRGSPLEFPFVIRNNLLYV